MSALKLVIFDWAGTTIDHGSVAPLAAFVRTFAEQGVTVTPAQARGPMGLEKAAHLRTMLRNPEVAAAWRHAHGRDWTEADVAILYQRFVPLQLATIADHARLVPELLPCVAALRQADLKIGATTGYFQAAAKQVCAAALAQGYVPDHAVCAEDVPEGRPAPWMIFRVMETLRVYPPAAVVKVGDTVPDIGEGRAAGAWSIGVLRSSSEVGCTEAEWAALPRTLQVTQLTVAREKLLAAGAHAVIETLAELPALVADLSARTERGERP